MMEYEGYYAYSAHFLFKLFELHAGAFLVMISGIQTDQWQDYLPLPTQLDV